MGDFPLFAAKRRGNYKKNDVIGDVNLRAYCKYRAG
jgi:hypothetical protein